MHTLFLFPKCTHVHRKKTWSKTVKTTIILHMSSKFLVLTVYINDDVVT